MTIIDITHLIIIIAFSMTLLTILILYLMILTTKKHFLGGIATIGLAILYVISLVGIVFCLNKIGDEFSKPSIETKKSLISETEFEVKSIYIDRVDYNSTILLLEDINNIKENTEDKKNEIVVKSYNIEEKIKLFNLIIKKHSRKTEYTLYTNNEVIDILKKIEDPIYYSR